MYIVTDHMLTHAHRFCPSHLLPYFPSPHFTPDRTITPELIVIHYTAGASSTSSAEWCSNPSSHVSYHLIIDRDGSIIQLVPFNRRAWHAGYSFFSGRTDCNSFSIGIALSNYGFLFRTPDGRLRTSDRLGAPALIPDPPVFCAIHKHTSDPSPSSPSLWEAFTVKQIFSLRLVISALVSYYPIKAIAGHDDVSPGRKLDPGPAFPPLPLLIPSDRAHILLRPSLAFPYLNLSCRTEPFFFCAHCALSFNPDALDDYPETPHCTSHLDYPGPQYCPLCGSALSFFS